MTPDGLPQQVSQAQAARLAAEQRGQTAEQLLARMIEELELERRSSAEMSEALEAFQREAAQKLELAERRVELAERRAGSASARATEAEQRLGSAEANVSELDQKVKSLVDDFGRALEQQLARATAAREAALAEAEHEHERRTMQLAGEMAHKEQAAALSLARAEEMLVFEREQRTEERRSLQASLLLAQAEAEEAHEAAKAAVSQVLLSNAELARVVNVRLPQAVEEVRRHGAQRERELRTACKCSPRRPPSPQVRRHGAQRERELRENLASTEAKRAELADKLHEVETRHRDAMELQAELKLQMMSETRARQRAENAAAARAAELADTARTADELHVATAAARAAAVKEVEEARREAVARQQAAESQLNLMREAIKAAESQLNLKMTSDCLGLPLIASDCLPHQAAESQLNELRSLLAVKGDVTQEREQLTRMRERAQDEAEERRRAESELTNKLTNTQLALERATSASTQAREQLEVLINLSASHDLSYALIASLIRRASSSRCSRSGSKRRQAAP